jgi:DNA-binding transcriptional LysR family regulator
MAFDLAGLETFVAIADRGSFLRAAEHLHITQTAVSHRIRKLEEDIGFPLLLRTTREVTLTPAGQELLPKARQILGDVSGFFGDLRKKGAEKQHMLAIGCLPTLSAGLLPAILARFTANHPEVRLRIHDNSALEIANGVQEGRMEFGITILSTNRWDLEAKPLLEEPFVLVVPVHDVLAARQAISWQEIEGRKLVRISTQTGNRILIDDALGERGERLNWHYEVQHVATAVNLVAQGLALTIVPQSSFEVGRSAGVVALPLHDPRITRIIGVVTKRGLPLSAPASALMAEVSAHLHPRIKHE